MSTALLRELSPEIFRLPQAAQELAHKVARKLLPRLETPKPDKVEEYNKSITGMGRAIKTAEEAGMTVVAGTPRTLMLDLDKGAEIHEANYKMMCDLLGEEPLATRWTSKSGKGTHVVLQFEKATFTPAEAIALEVSLGSDPKRAVLYVLRLKNNVTEPRVLFMPPRKEEL
jgi:hypothetical protein